MIVLIKDFVTKASVIVTPVSTAPIVASKSVPTDAQDMASVRKTTRRVSVILVGLDMTAL